MIYFYKGVAFSSTSGHKSRKLVSSRVVHFTEGFPFIYHIDKKIGYVGAGMIKEEGSRRGEACGAGKKKNNNPFEFLPTQNR